VEGSAAGHAYPNNTCSNRCLPLAPHDWLANQDYWRTVDGDTAIVAVADTYLKKSLLQSGALPAAEKLLVKNGTACPLLAREPEQGYYLCTGPAHV